MGVKPTVTITADGKDVTDAIMARLSVLTIEDCAGEQSDRLTLELSNADEKLEAPAEGRVLKVLLGYDGNVSDMGQYVVDEIEAAGPPSTVTVHARSTPFDADGQYGTMQSKKRRSFDQATLSQIVGTVASDAGLSPVVASSLSSTLVAHIDQTDESDINFLSRLAKTYGAYVKPAYGKLLFLVAGDGKTASGAAATPITVTREKVSRYTYNRCKREALGSVVATWYDSVQGLDMEAKEGVAEPVGRIPYSYPSEQEARAAAAGKLHDANRGADKVTFTMSGDTTMQAGVPLTVSGFPIDMDGDYTVKKVTHTVSPSDGYTVSVEAETTDDGDSDGGGGGGDPGGLG